LASLGRAARTGDGRSNGLRTLTTHEWPLCARSGRSFHLKMPRLVQNGLLEPFLNILIAAQRIWSARTPASFVI
jgi:hypothetical protein